MARPRTPKAKAEVSGSAMHDPGRFKDRLEPKRVRPIGEPYARMTDGQKVCWEEFRAELPWLNSGHRTILRMACILAARMDSDPEFGVQATQALSSILSKLGATPVDETKVNHADGEDEDPNDRFFGRPH
jgi:hypothetical protein